MILCASRTDGDGVKSVRLLEVPAAAPGTRVQWGGEADVAADAAPMGTSKLGKLLKQLHTDEAGTLVWGEGEAALPGTVGGETITCKEMPSSVVS